jgi:predicted nucleotidyltransferase
MAMKLTEDFKDFLKLLNEHQVKYLLIGGLAVAVHGYPRATGDMDIWIANDVNNAERITEVVRKFGFNLPQVQPDLFLKTDKIIRMGVPPVRIELFLSVTGLNFEECYQNRIIKNIDGIEVKVIDLSNLIKNKKIVGRNRDLDDIENLT